MQLPRAAVLLAACRVISDCNYWYSELQVMAREHSHEHACMHTQSKDICIDCNPISDPSLAICRCFMHVLLHHLHALTAIWTDAGGPGRYCRADTTDYHRGCQPSWPVEVCHQRLSAVPAHSADSFCRVSGACAITGTRGCAPFAGCSHSFSRPGWSGGTGESLSSFPSSFMSSAHKQCS